MRLIDADALLQTIQKNEYELLTKHNSTGCGMFTVGIKQAIDESPTIDPVKHGRWIVSTARGFGDAKECSDCGSPEGVKLRDCKYNYCPHCGARMDGEV